MASRSVKLSESFIEVATEESRVMERTIGGQIEYWAKIGRQVEASGALGVEGVRLLLMGKGSVQALTAADEPAYLDALTSKLESLDGSDSTVVDSLRARGVSIASADDDGKLFIEKP